MSDVEYLPPPETAPPVPPMSAEPLPAPPAADEYLPEPPRAARRLWLRSLTSRLVVGVVALVIVLVGAVGACTYYALRSFLYDRLDQQLAPIAATNQNRLSLCLSSPGQTCGLGSPPGGYRAALTEWIAVLRPDASSAVQVSPASSASLRGMALSTTQRRILVADPRSAQTLTTTDGTQLRVSAVTLDLPTGRFVVVSGLSTGEITRTLGRLIAIELIIGGAAVALALGATSWGVRRSLRNLYRVTGTAQEVAAELSLSGGGLDRRVPVVEEGTEVGQLAESMNTLLSAVETQFAARIESEQRMRQFLADASHELRTPLTSIRGYAELARMRRATGASASDSAENLDRIESEGTRMSRLVDDLLMLARGDADEPAQFAARELVDIADLLDDAVQGSQAAYPDRTIELAAESVPPVLGDRDQLLRVVRNLITNAAVHTEAGRPVDVYARGQDGGVLVTIVDGGPGLPPDQAARVFERFWRADKARTRARGGSGLGLAIVSAIVSSHGGRVDFRSSVESGSTVTVWLPAAT